MRYVSHVHDETKDRLCSIRISTWDNYTRLSCTNILSLFNRTKLASRIFDNGYCPIHRELTPYRVLLLMIAWKTERICSSYSQSTDTIDTSSTNNEKVSIFTYDSNSKSIFKYFFERIVHEQIRLHLIRLKKLAWVCFSRRRGKLQYCRKKIKCN